MDELKAAAEGDIFSLAQSVGQKAASVAKALKPEPKQQAQPKAQQAPAPAPERDIQPDIHISPYPRRR